MSTMAPKNMKDEVQLYRKIIARYAAAFVSENDTIFINTSSNALQVTVITNNGKAIGREYCPGVNVVLTGGKLRHTKDAMVGDFTLRNLQHVYAKKAFVGCSGISAELGMTTEIFNDTDGKAFDDALNAIREKGIQVYQVHKSDF